ncbi:hypothetical protein LIER_25219 [Lithospermum erythrorhizon]|uniref:Uncharacterized protein n=1 Tax=Lithospermum erythrorhizon TaxID=34254 RepID=A0AAV3R6Z5_LITER
MGRSDTLIKDRTISSEVRFLLLDMQLCCGIPAGNERLMEFVHDCEEENQNLTGQLKERIEDDELKH